MRRSSVFMFFGGMNMNAVRRRKNKKARVFWTQASFKIGHRPAAPIPYVRDSTPDSDRGGSGGCDFLKQRNPQHNCEGGSFKIGHRPTLPRFTAVPSALAGLTSLFGMGRGRHRRYRHLNILRLKLKGWKVKGFYLHFLLTWFFICWSECIGSRKSYLLPLSFYLSP